VVDASLASATKVASRKSSVSLASSLRITFGPACKNATCSKFEQLFCLFTAMNASCCPVSMARACEMCPVCPEATGQGEFLTIVGWVPCFSPLAVHSCLRIARQRTTLALLWQSAAASRWWENQEGAPAPAGRLCGLRLDEDHGQL